MENKEFFCENIAISLLFLSLSFFFFLFLSFSFFMLGIGCVINHALGNKVFKER